MERREFLRAVLGAVVAPTLVGPPDPTRLFERVVGPGVDVVIDQDWARALGAALSRYIDEEIIFPALSGRKAGS